MNTRFSIAMLLFLFSISLLPSAFAYTPLDSMKVFAVTNNGNGLAADLILEIEPGDGTVWSSLDTLVGTTTQSAERTSINVASTYVEDTSSYDYKFRISSQASLVDGPSAGAAMTLLVISMLQDNNVPDNVAITGTITSDGFVGPVGGIYEKAKEASNIGIELFLIPDGEARQIVNIDGKIQTINIIDYAWNEWDLKVVEVENIDDVLDFAFSDVQDLDVNAIKSETEIPDFTPQPVNDSNSIAVMKNITNKYIRGTRADIENAKNSLSGSILDDPELIDILLASLNNAEDSLKETELLAENNYLYSAANYAFLAGVNANLVKDIADNPSIATSNSTLFKSKIEALDSEITDFEKKLSEKIPVENIEWHIAAKQRLTYAKIKVQELKQLNGIDTDEQVTVVSTQGKYDEVLLQIQDYEFAKGWLNVARDFHEVSSSSSNYISNEPVFTDSLDEFLVQTENGLTLLDDIDTSDILRRLDAAKSEKQRQWYLAAITDSASALALTNAEITWKNYEDESLDDLMLIVENQINAIDLNMQSNNYKYAWPKLYLDHSNYYLSLSKYYKDEGQPTKARSVLRNAIALYSLASNTHIIDEEIDSYLSGKESDYLPVSQDADSGETITSSPSQISFSGNGFYAAAGIGFISGFIVSFLIFLIFFYRRKNNSVFKDSGSHTLETKLNEMEKFEKESEKARRELHSIVRRNLRKNYEPKEVRSEVRRWPREKIKD